MILIIAEKPSLARNIAGAIGAKVKRNGYIEGEGYYITWAFGHLFSLCDIEEYSPSPDGTGRWTMANLPCFPESFKYRLRGNGKGETDSGTARQFEIIKELCCRENIEAIVNAGDADREGEIIIRLCVSNALKTENENIAEKKQLRLWLPDQTPQTIKAALAEMKDETEYDNLANEGFARTYIDWLYGVNLTRYATLKSGTLLRVGRVIIPIVKAIYDRDMAIRNFVPEKYLSLLSKAETKGEVIELASKRKFAASESAAAQKLCGEYNAAGAVVSAVKRKKEKLFAGKLYSLSRLQNALGKKYKMSMDKSLEILQKLYEEGFVTYPRTNSEYLATAEQGKIKTIIENISKMGYNVTFKGGRNIFDDSKIESHSALTPTYKIPAKGQLSEDEYKVYSAIFRRFAAVFCSQDCIVDKTEITIDVGDMEQFTLKGTVMLEPGWTKYEEAPAKDKMLPKLEKGERVNIDFKPAEKETTPPRHYTIETLNNYLKNPFREEKAALSEEQETVQVESERDDTEDYKAIFEGLELGTEATRTGIIDNAKKSEYIALKKDVYTILPGGEFLINSLARMGISMDKYKTSEMGRALKKVYHGKMSVMESVKLAEEEIAQVFSTRRLPPETDTDDGFIGDIVGKCPLCGKDVTRSKKGYGCTGYKEGCKLFISGFICGRVISKANAALLLSTGKSAKIKGFVSPRTGREFEAALVLKEGRAEFDFAN